MKRKNILVFCHGDIPRLAIFETLLPHLGFDVTVVHTRGGDPLPESASHYDGQIIMGGACSIRDIDSLPWLKEEAQWIKQAADNGMPTLGICLGAQMLSYVYGGKVQRGDKHPSAGFSELKMNHHDAIFGDELCGKHVALWHEDVYSRPEGVMHLMGGSKYPEQAAKYADHVYGVQFHPEAVEASVERWYREDILSGRWATAQAVEWETMLKQSREFLPDTHAWLEGFLERLFKS
ncbi:MAG: type 1 glutamine amidotransferase [Alphaproteobacteria bacterium]|nr:type 1 glutamine amidotransferase [Alphaproteobacteria bacterium]